jgi:hypothetical protein
MRLFRIHARDAVVDRDEHGYGEEYDRRPEGRGEGDKKTRTVSQRPMFVGCSEDECKGESVPQRHDFAEDARYWSCGFGMGAGVEAIELGMDKDCHGKLVPRQGCTHRRNDYVVGERHKWLDAADWAAAS